MICKSCKIDCIKKFNLEIYNQEVLDQIPLIHVTVINEFVHRNIISLQKKDKVLVEYMKRNNIYYSKNEICYLELATKMPGIKNDFNNYMSENDLVKFWIGYLYFSFGKADDEDNELKNIFKSIKKTRIKNKYSEAVIKVRKNQQCFRDELLRIHGKCQICNLENRDMLIASHSKRYSVCNDEESGDIYNGLLLCRSHDGLYDSGLITFNDDGKIQISERLSNSDRKILGINEDISINLMKENLKYIKWHRENIFK